LDLGLLFVLAVGKFSFSMLRMLTAGASIGAYLGATSGDALTN
jgi:hypothetical protein